MERNDLWLNVKGNCIFLFREYLIIVAVDTYACLSVCLCLYTITQKIMVQST